MSIFDKTSQLKKQQMFFGDGHFIQEFLEPAYPWALKSADRQNSQDWAWDEFPLKLDAAQLSSANNAIRHIFTSNLQSQIFADTVQGRGPAWLMPYLSDPSLEYAFTQWGRFECFTADHELLTPEGWLPITNITMDHKIAQYNQNSEIISFINPTALIQKEYDGDLYHINSKHGYVNQLVTENHRIPLIYKRDGVNKPTEVLAKDFNPNGRYALPTGGYLKHGSGMTALEKLFVAVQADGTTASGNYTGERTGTLHYKFKLKKKRKIERITDLIKKTGFDYKIYPVKEESYSLIYVHIPLEDYNHNAKTFDWIDYENISCEWIEDFIQELTYWDGCRSGGTLRYMTSNKYVLDKVNTIAHLGGYRAHTYVVPPTERVFPGNHLRKCKEGYQITFSKTTSANSKSLSITPHNFKGTVYCVSVPDSFILVKRQETISVSGQCLHSRTYTNILTSMYPNPRIVLDMIEQKPEVFSRFSQCVQAYDVFFADPTKENLVILIAAINILEGLSFYASFICNFAFANMGLFESVSKFLKLISRDEALHLGLTQQIIKTWRTGKDGKEWKDIWNRNKDRIHAMYCDAVQEEYRWSAYLFQYGTPIVGLNEETLNRSIEYYANKRMINIGLKPYNNVTVDPLPWVQTKYLSNSGFQDAPQEVSIVAYLKGNMTKVDDVKDITNLFKNHRLTYTT